MIPEPSPAQLSGASWRTSTYSAPNNDCVEIADGFRGWVGVRDSKAPEGPALLVSTDAFTAFVSGVRA